ncbi:unnamed protein product, partial [Porites lobata]
MAMQRGLQEIAEVTVVTPPLELIRLAQAKFRALSKLEKAYSEEVLSLRRRSDLLQESLDKAQLDYEREKASRQREIRHLREQLNQLETQQLERLREATRDHEERQDLDKCRALLENATRDLNSITAQKRLVEQKLAQSEWQEQVETFNRQLAEAAPGEAVKLRLERDQLKRELLDLNARLNHLEQTRTERDRLEAVNEQLRLRLEECERHRSFQDDLVLELKHQVATLEQRIREADRVAAIVHPHLTEPEFQEDEIPGLPSSS